MNIWILIASLIGAGIFIWWLGLSQGRRRLATNLRTKELWEYVDPADTVFKILRVNDISIIDGKRLSTEMVVQMQDGSVRAIRTPGSELVEIGSFDLTLNNDLAFSTGGEKE